MSGSAQNHPWEDMSHLLAAGDALAIDTFLDELPAEQEATVRALSSYLPDVAGGLMLTDAPIRQPSPR